MPSDDVDVTEYKTNLTQALKIQTKLEKELARERKVNSKKHKDLLNENNKLKADNDVLTNSLAAAQQKIETLDHAAEAQAQNQQELQEQLNYQKKMTAQLVDEFKQLEASLLEEINKNKKLERQLSQKSASYASTLYNEKHFNVSAPDIFNEKPTAEKPAYKKSVEHGAGQYSLFNLKRFFGSSQDAKPGLASENPATNTLAEITKARVEQALVEKTLAGKSFTKS